MPTPRQPDDATQRHETDETPAPTHRAKAAVPAVTPVDPSPEPDKDDDKISVIQIIAATSASTTAAVVANLLGVMGTVVGVAVISVVSSLATALYLRSMKRTGRHIKAVVQQVPQLPVPLRHPAPTTPTDDAATPSLTSTRKDSPSDATALDRTTVIDKPTEESASAPAKPFPWKRFAISTVAVFALSIGALTAFALMSGDPPATYWHSPGQANEREDQPGDAEQPDAPVSETPSVEPSTTESPTPEPTSPTPTSPKPSPSTTEPTTDPDPSDPPASPELPGEDVE
ncbi:hypothetical protein [Stackebrandtia soli]|uniref:hypothetical protein n=1 Tax=Stackebrandtia soli TaxID=1892856 RepID=UPI0039EAF14F